MQLSLPVGARHAAPEQRRAPIASRWRGIAAIRRCCCNDETPHALPVGARHAAPEQRRARTASRPNSAAPEQRRAPTVLPWRGVAAIRRCRSCRSNEASSRLMPVGARHAAPEQRRARTAPRPNSAAPEQRRARTAPRPNSAALAWRRCNPARQRSRWDRHSAAGCACAPPRRHQSAQECRKLCYRRHPPARSRSRRRGVPFGCMALI